MDRDSYGGAPLLGLNGTVIKAHGSARPIAIKNSLRSGFDSACAVNSASLIAAYRGRKARL